VLKPRSTVKARRIEERSFNSDQRFMDAQGSCLIAGVHSPAR